VQEPGGARAARRLALSPLKTVSEHGGILSTHIAKGARRDRAVQLQAPLSERAGDAHHEQVDRATVLNNLADQTPNSSLGTAHVSHCHCTDGCFAEEFWKATRERRATNILTRQTDDHVPVVRIAKALSGNRLGESRP
jgi:hypothetical protein